MLGRITNEVWMHRFEALQARLAEFVAEREWGQFHTPRNLAACLSVEAGELLELYLWTREGPGPHPPGAGAPRRSAVEAEVGDVMLCLLNFCAAENIDPIAAAGAKLNDVALKYPVELARGSAVKQPGRNRDDAVGGNAFNRVDRNNQAGDDVAAENSVQKREIEE